MSLLKIYQGQALRKALAEIITSVEVVYLALDEPEPDTLAALNELKSLTPLLSLTRLQLSGYEETDRVIVRGEQGGEMVFAGPPIGTELAALVSAIVVAGRGDSGLSAPTRERLAGLPGPVHLQIFTTPTWASCAQAVSLAHKFAFESHLVTAEAVSAVVYLDLARSYGVLGTPHVVLNGEHHLKGNIREEGLLAAILLLYD
jgi:NADH-dependent peroxiredoxin subunit F